MDKHNGILNSLFVFSGLVFLGLCIVYASNSLTPTLKEEPRYQIVQLNESNIAVIDHQTNRIYTKFISPNEGPTDWREMVMPN